MTASRLFLSGIRASGHHGARRGEKDAAQEFVVDLDLDVDAAGDEIEATADYRAIVETVRSVVQERSFDLIETMANAIAEEVHGLEHVGRVTAVVHKPGAAARLEVDGVAAAATVGGDGT
jgi:7,8-dihydroneopterin aldolase/epimerase/oxygenase